MLRILNTTLVSADCKNPDAALSAMSICLNQAEFDDVVFFNDKDQLINPGRTIKIPKINSTQDYSRFLFRDLYKYIRTKYIMICQYDGFIINTKSWDNEFYKYDYIGAPWNHHKGQVGNGGFSFRTVKLHKIISDPSFDRYHPEDAMICQKYRNLLENKYQMKFAPKQIAEKFSLETNPNQMAQCKPFGFHGKSCINQAKKIANTNYQPKMGVKCYLRPINHIPLL